MLSETDVWFLCNFDSLEINSDGILEKLCSSKWIIEDLDLFKNILDTQLKKDELEKFFKKYFLSDSFEKPLSNAISSLLTFCYYNWSPYPDDFNLEKYLGGNFLKYSDILDKLQCDSEPIYLNILYPELLYISLQVFGVLSSIKPNLLHLWWYFRSKVLHQRALEETSATLYSELEIIIAKLFNVSQTLQLQPRLKVLLYTEMAQAYLIYGRVQKAEDFLMKAREIAGIKLELTGILGKRTKFQQSSLPQLALSSELDISLERPSAEQSHDTSDLPPNIELQDDVRLNKIQYLQQIVQAELPSLEQTLCLLTVQHLQKAQPRDDLMQEELQPYIEAILSQKNGPWSTRVAALLMRCKLESGHKRSVERSMMQCEAIVNDKKNIARTSRLSYLWASGLQPAWTWRQQLADLYLSLGMVKAALEEYQRLKLWEDVIVCYTVLQLRHKAAVIIQQQIDIEPSVKLYCLLGDATDDVKWYEKAWEFSEYKSSRAQRHWGNFLFNSKKYDECIPHYELSVEINSIQESVWLRLGFAALMTEQWELSAKAYRRYTYLQPNSFEAWNNLAKVYVNQGDKKRAYRALLEALRFNYDNWKLWENVITVSMDTGHFEDVIRGCHRLLEIRGQFQDVEVLRLLTTAITQDVQDAEGHHAGRLRKRVLELFGRITSVHQNNPELWLLYADLSASELLKAQRLLRAYRGYSQIGTWSSNPDTCKKVTNLTQYLLEISLNARQKCEEKDKLQCDQQLSSARLTGQAVLRMVEKQDWPETQNALIELKVLYNNVTEYMKTII